MCDRPMNVRMSIEAIDRLFKCMIGWVLEYDGINVSSTLDFLIEVKNEKRLLILNRNYFVLF